MKIAFAKNIAVFRKGNEPTWFTLSGIEIFMIKLHVLKYILNFVDDIEN